MQCKQILKNTQIPQTQNFPISQQQQISPFLDSYRTLLPSFKKQSQIQKLFLHQIIYLETSSAPSNLSSKAMIEVNSLRSSVHCQVNIIQVKIGQFSLRLAVLVVGGESPTHSLSKRASGAYGTIFTPSLIDQKIAIKCLYTEHQNKQKQLRILKEYCLSKIASALQIGPLIHPQFGFDLIIYDECIEFAMQYCIPLQQIPYPHKNMEKDIKNALAALHCLNIVHVDLKPDNICYSISRNEYVLIDFGLSQFISEQIGYRTHTHFTGSISYCSQEMKQIFQSQESTTGFVDMYYNDVHGLQKILQLQDQMKIDCMQSEEWRKTVNISQDPEQQKLLTKSYLKYMIKYCIFKQDIYKLKSLKSCIDQSYIKSLSQELIQFISELKPSLKLKQFYYQYLAPHFLDTPQIEHIGSKAECIQVVVSNQNKKRQNEAKMQFLKGNTYLDRMKTTKYHINIREYLMNLSEIMLTKTIVYYRKWLNFIRFDQNIYKATLIQKEKCTLILLNSINSTISLANNCQDNIVLGVNNVLEYCLTNYNKYPKQTIVMIPILFTQGIILDAWTHLEMRDIIQRSTSLLNNPQQKLSLFVEFILSAEWLNFKYISRHQYYHLYFMQWLNKYVRHWCSSQKQKLSPTALLYKQLDIISLILPYQFLTQLKSNARLQQLTMDSYLPDNMQILIQFIMIKKLIHINNYQQINLHLNKIRDILSDEQQQVQFHAYHLYYFKTCLLVRDSYTAAKLLSKLQHTLNCPSAFGRLKLKGLLGRCYSFEIKFASQEYKQYIIDSFKNHLVCPAEDLVETICYLCNSKDIKELSELINFNELKRKYEQLLDNMIKERLLCDYQKEGNTLLVHLKWMATFLYSDKITEEQASSAKMSISQQFIYSSYLHRSNQNHHQYYQSIAQLIKYSEECSSDDRLGKTQFHKWKAIMLMLQQSEHTSINPDILKEYRQIAREIATFELYFMNWSNLLKFTLIALQNDQKWVFLFKIAEWLAAHPSNANLQTFINWTVQNCVAKMKENQIWQFLECFERIYQSKFWKAPCVSFYFAAQLNILSLSKKLTIKIVMLLHQCIPHIPNKFRSLLINLFYLSFLLITKLFGPKKQSHLKKRLAEKPLISDLKKKKNSPIIIILQKKKCKWNIARNGPNPNQKNTIQHYL